MALRLLQWLISELATGSTGQESEGARTSGRSVGAFYHVWSGATSTRSDTVFLRRCKAFYAENSEVTPTQRKRKRCSDRGCGRLGRHSLAPSFRWSLWLWFRAIRGSIKGSLPIAVLLGQARVLRLQYMRAAARNLIPALVPQLTYGWLRRWMKEYVLC